MCQIMLKREQGEKKEKAIIASQGCDICNHVRKLELMEGVEGQSVLPS